jgi:ATP-dependent helicase/nuclease subunit B
MLEPAALPLLVGSDAEMRMSVSRLEGYAACPQLDFFRKVLKLEPGAETDREVTPRDKGSVVHRILYEFHSKVSAERVPREDHGRVLEAIARRELAKLPYDGLFGETFRDFLTRDLLRAGPAADPGLLRAYLDAEDLRGGAFRPAFFEARFGPLPRGAAPESLLSPDPIRLFDVELDERTLAVVLTGSIDRVDLREEGGELEAIVLDYKTGDVTGQRREAERGRLFQLPLYAHVLPRLLAPRLGGRKVRPIAAAYYQLRKPAEVGIEEPLVDQSRRGQVTKKKLDVLPDGGFDRLVADYVARARDVVAAQLAGRFHPTAIRDSCEFCDFGDVCRGRGEAARIERMPASSRFAQSVELVAREPRRKKP